MEQLQGDVRDFLNSKKAENKVSNDKNDAHNVKRTPNINFGLIDQRLAKEGLLVSGKNLNNALKKSNEGIKR